MEDLVCEVTPFLLKDEVVPRKEPSELSRRVYLMNLPYDASVREIQDLCKEFAPIDKVAIPRDP